MFLGRHPSPNILKRRSTKETSETTIICSSSLRVGRSSLFKPPEGLLRTGSRPVPCIIPAQLSSFQALDAKIPNAHRPATPSAFPHPRWGSTPTKKLSRRSDLRYEGWSGLGKSQLQVQSFFFSSRFVMVRCDSKFVVVRVTSVTVGYSTVPYVVS